MADIISDDPSSHSIKAISLVVFKRYVFNRKLASKEKQPYGTDCPYRKVFQLLIFTMMMSRCLPSLSSEWGGPVDGQVNGAGLLISKNQVNGAGLLIAKNKVSKLT